MTVSWEGIGIGIGSAVTVIGGMVAGLKQYAKGKPVDGKCTTGSCPVEDDLVRLEKKVVDGFEAVANRFNELETSQKLASAVQVTTTADIQKLYEITRRVEAGMSEIKGMLEAILRTGMLERRVP